MRIAALEKQTMSRRIVLDGEYHTRRNNSGFTLSRGDSAFVDELQMTSGVTDAVLGEFILRVNGDSETDFDAARTKLGLQVYPVGQGVSRACIASARFVVVKGFAALPSQLAVRRAGLVNYVTVFGLCPDPTESMLLSEALRLDVETCKGEYNLDGKDMLLVTDKVFVAECARRCGVSEYIHTNLSDIAHVFIGVRPRIAVLNCGDFSNEHVRLGITEVEYKNILRKHYASVGYRSLGGVSPYVMWKSL